MRPRITLLLALVATVPAVSPVCAETFTDILGRAPITRPVGEAMSRSVARSLPVIAASAGVTFTFNRETHAFERQTEVLGQVLLERATPLGRGKWNLNLSYEWVHLDTVDGRDLSRLRDTSPQIVDTEGARFMVPRFDLGLTTHQVTTSVTWGATDDLDLNLTVPVLESTFTLREFFFAPAQNGLPAKSQASNVSGTELGVGDVLVRAKQRLARGGWGNLAAGLVLRTPTGNEKNFQGTGTWELSPMLYASTPSARLAPTVRLQGYVNAGVDLDAGDVDHSEGRFGLGLDLALAERVTAALAVLGREPFAALASPGFFDLPRANSRPAPFLGLDRGRPRFYDLAIGGRVNLWRDTVIGFAHVIVPLNDDGFRADAIPLAGIEAAF